MSTELGSHLSKDVGQQPNIRPLAVTVVCIIGFIGLLVGVPLTFSDTARNIGAWFPPYHAFALVVGAICMVGLWMMRKWAVFTYAGFVVLNQVILLMMGVWNIFALLIPVVVIAIGISHLSKMR